MIDNMLDFFQNDPMGYKIIGSIIAIVVIIIISRIIKNFAYKKFTDNRKYYTFKQKTNYVIGVAIIVVLLFIWLDSFSNLTTYIGLLSAGIAIALKEIFTNMAGWMFIESRKPFEVGHRITIGDQKGDVIDKRLFQFSIMEVSSYADGEQSTGRIVDIPNSFIFLYPCINYTKGFEYVWNEVKVLLTFESDWKKAKQLLTDIANRDTAFTTDKVAEQIKQASKKYMIHYNKLTPIVYTDVLESGVQLTLRYLCAPKMRRVTTNSIWEDILDMVATHEDVNLAYPTKRVIQG